MKKHDFDRNHHQKNGRLREFMKGQTSTGKIARTNDISRRKKNEKFDEKKKTIKISRKYVYFLNSRKKNEIFDFEEFRGGGG